MSTFADRLRQVRGMVDLGGTMASGVGHDIVGGWKGIAALPKGIDAAVDAVRAEQARTRQPATPEGAGLGESLGNLATVYGQALPHQVPEAWESVTNASPALGAGIAGVAGVAGGPGQEGLVQGFRRVRPSVLRPLRRDYPGIYKDPRQIVQEAAARVPPEDPLMERLFGVTRGDLERIGGDRPGNVPGLIPGAAANPKGSAAVQAVATVPNARRLANILQAARENPQLAQSRAWYTLDPLQEAFNRELGPEEGPRRFERMNALMAMASPSNAVLPEINRGTAANWLYEQGRWNDFATHGGGADLLDRPEDMAAVLGHAYHSTAHEPAMSHYLATGEMPESPKVPLYEQASRGPALGFQTDVPVADAHFARGIGLADVRAGGKPAKSASTAELQALTPWWRELSGQADLEPVQAQALAWNVLGPQTGVDSPIGAPKLELFSQQVGKAAQRMGVTPEEALSRIIRGNAHAGAIDPDLLLPMGAAAIGGTAGYLVGEDLYGSQ